MCRIFESMVLIQKSRLAYAVRTHRSASEARGCGFVRVQWGAHTAENMWVFKGLRLGPKPPIPKELLQGYRATTTLEGLIVLG